jgi:hypothetical protein
MASARSVRIAKLEVKLKAQLQAELAEAEAKVRNLKARIAALDTVAGPPVKRRPRTSSDEMQSRILAALKKHRREGLSQKQIADASGLNYMSVALFLKRNTKLFKTKGEFKKKRYFLK